MSNEEARYPAWMWWVLITAAIYNLAWGSFAVLVPALPFRMLGVAIPNYLSLWQCIGMIVGVYGIGYGIAAMNPVRHWPIVLVGLLGKIFGPIGFIWTAMKGELPWAAGATILTNDVMWWIPFGLILLYARRVDPQSFRLSGPPTGTSKNSSSSAARVMGRSFPAVSVSVRMNDPQVLIERIS
ncbi:MAG: alkyl hydroperoxide reductase [Planctomycetia bacterium]